jgi:hypothetical protein
MSAGISIKIENVPATLRALNKIDPDLRKKVPAEIKSYAQPIVADAKAALPSSAPMSGWNRGRFKYSASKARSGIRLQFKGTRPRNAPADAWPVLRVKSTNAAAAVFDIAGRKSTGKTTSGSRMIRQLNSTGGRASRTIWPAVEKHVKEVEHGIEEIFKKYADIASKGLAKWQ